MTVLHETKQVSSPQTVVSQGKSIMINAVRNDMEKRFGGVNKDNIWLQIAYTYDLDAATQLLFQIIQGIQHDIDAGIEFVVLQKLLDLCGIHAFDRKLHGIQCGLSLLRLKPVLQIQGDKLDAFAKARTVSQGKSIMINAVRNSADCLWVTEIRWLLTTCTLPS